MLVPSIRGYSRGVRQIERAQGEAEILRAYARAVTGQLTRAIEEQDSLGNFFTSTERTRARALGRAESFLFQGVEDTRLGIQARSDLLRGVEILTNSRMPGEIHRSAAQSMDAHLRAITGGLMDIADARNRIAALRMKLDEVGDVRAEILADLERQGRLLPESDATPTASATREAVTS